MKKILLLITLAVFAAVPAMADEALDVIAALNVDTNYSKTIESRTEDIVKPLNLGDPAKEARVHDVIVNQYRVLKAWHTVNDPKLKAAGSDTNAQAQIRASLKVIHDQYLAKLAQDLTQDQVDQVKDKMVYGKVQVTYKAYCDIIPDLTNAQKAHILEVLKEAREEGIDGANVKEKDAIFKKYKGRISNYLAKQGVDEQKARKEWYQKYQEQKKASAANSTAKD